MIANPNERTWFFLIEVSALAGENQPLAEGSEAELQVFVPAVSLERALSVLDDFLSAEAFRRTDVRIVRRYTQDEGSDNDALQKGIQAARESGRAQRGLLFFADDSAQWKEPGADDSWKH